MKTNRSQLRFLNRSKETGQALVLIALLMVILLGMLGLAIDGGGMFLLWRDAQNAVDAAALQAAFAYCTNGEDLPSAQAAGFTATEMNGFDNNEVDNWVIVDRAANVVDPSQLPSNASVKNDIILVQITAEKPSYFIQLLYNGPLKITVTALGVCNAGGETFFEGYGVYAMGNCPGSSYKEADFTGSSAHFFSNIGSNGDLRAQGGGSNIIFHSSDGELAGVSYVNNIDDLSKFATDPSGSTVPGSDVQQVQKDYDEYPTLFTWDEFAPGGEAWNDVDMINGTLGDPSDTNVHYYDIDYSFTDEVQGLWVIDGDVSFTKDFRVGPNGVTIVASGQIGSSGTINNKNDPTLWKPYSLSEYTNSLVFFSTYHPNGIPPTDCEPASHGAAGFELSGSGIIGQGLIYVPYAPVVWSGSNAFWCGSIIAQTVSSSGSDKWFFTEDIPSDDAIRNAADITGQPDDADWFIDTDFMPEGTSCDFVPESDSEVFLGDLPS